MNIFNIPRIYSEVNNDDVDIRNWNFNYDDFLRKDMLLYKNVLKDAAKYRQINGF